MRLKKNDAGMSVIDIVIGVAILGFFVTFLPQAITQSRRYYQRAEVKTELTRIRQNMLIGTRNIERVKKDLIFSIGPARVDEFMNCFGQRGPGQSTEHPIPKGTNCQTKFSGGWDELKEDPTNALVFKKEWTLRGEKTGAEPDMFKTWAKFYLACEASRCNSVHVMIGMTPTGLMDIQNKPEGASLAAEDFVERRAEVVFPGTIFGSHNAITTRQCVGDDTFIEFLSTQYNQFYCNTGLANNMACAVSLRGLNTNGCDITVPLTDDRRVNASYMMSGGQVTSVSTVGLPSDSRLDISLCARPVGNYGTTVDPSNPDNVIPAPYPDFSRGEQVAIDCGGIFSNVRFRSASDSETAAPQYCKTQSILVSTLNSVTSLDCSFSVLSASGGIKGAAEIATLRIISSTPPSTGGPTTTLVPGSTTSTTLGPSPPAHEPEVDSGEV